MTEPDYVASTRAAYDTVASDYAELLRNELSHRPVDRALLALFAELVGTGNPVADLGCGPGRVTGHLASLGLDAFGVDLSPAMIEVARRDFPQLTFIEGQLTGLSLGDRSVAGLVAWYSIIHTPPPQLPDVFAEFARVLASDGWLLLAFQVGDEQLHLSRAYDHDISLDVWRLDPAHVSALLADAGFAVTTQAIRAATDGEKSPQCYLLATNGSGR